MAGRPGDSDQKGPTHALDRPVWASLNFAPQLAEGSALAKRYLRDVNLFAASADEHADSLAALAALVEPGMSVYLLQVPGIVVPAGLRPLREAQGVQMLATQPIPLPAGGAPVLELGDADAPEMLALARLTEPGPFLARTHQVGRFIGVREGGALIAMAGERMRLAGHTELSGVCVHPDQRGRGLARQLSSTIAHGIQRRGEQAFLHAWASNRGAIALYESLGFALRAQVQVAVLAR